jgi:ABC-type multidrug transport system ATPase subunit
MRSLGTQGARRSGDGLLDWPKQRRNRMAHETVIATRALAKHYRGVRAVDGLTLEVRRGEVYGFLGRNGAGKTTTIRMLLGLIRPTAGEVVLFGLRRLWSGAPAFAKIGYLVESATAYPNLTVRENLEIQRRLMRSPPSAVGDAIELLRLGEYADRTAGTLSLGNKQLLSLARALLHSPEILVLDEPANALDPAGIVKVRELLRALANERSVTVFMSSHNLSEVAHLADRIGIIHEGRLLEELDIGELRARSRSYLEVRVSDPSRARILLAERLGAARIEERDGMLRVFGGAELASEVARAVVQAGLDLHSLTPVAEDLESYFLRLTGGQA